MVQEKAIAIILSMCEENELRKHAVECGTVSAAIKQISVGHPNGMVSGAWTLICLTEHLTEEERAETFLPIAKMIDSSQWPVKSAAASAIMRLYKTDTQKLAFIKKGSALDRLLGMLSIGDPRVHENTLGAILSLMENPEVSQGVTSPPHCRERKPLAISNT